MNYPNQYHYHPPDAEFKAAENRQYNDVIIRRVNEIIISRANVELYSAVYGDRNWNLIGSGVMYLMQNQSIYYLILFTTENLQAIWQREINRNVVYKIDKPYFHIVFVKDELFGINFADLTEAEMFYFAVDRLWPFKNLSKLLSKFGTRLANLFIRKKSPQVAAPNQNFGNVLTEAPKYIDGDQRFYRDELDEIPTNMAATNRGDRNLPNSRSNRMQVQYEDNGYYGNHNAGYVPTPPPLPPPVQNFHFATTSDRYMAPRNYYAGRYGRTRNNSFEAQIKQEAKRRHSGLRNYFKYLP